MNPWISALLGAFFGGTVGILAAALAAASARASWLEDHLLADDEDTTPTPGIYILETREHLDEETTREIAATFEAQTGGRVIILDAYQVDADDDDDYI